MRVPRDGDRKKKGKIIAEAALYRVSGRKTDIAEADEERLSLSKALGK